MNVLQILLMFNDLMYNIISRKMCPFGRGISEGQVLNGQVKQGMEEGN